MRKHTPAKRSIANANSQIVRDRQRLKARHLFLETLEIRQVLAGNFTEDLGVITAPGSLGVITQGGVDYTAKPTMAAGATTAEQLIEMEVAKSFIASSDMSQYTDAQLAKSLTWAVAVKPGTNIANLERQIGGRLVPSQIINGVYVYASPLMNENQNETVRAANARNTGSLLLHNPSVGGFMPLYPNTGEIEKHSVSPNPPNDPLFRLQWHLLDDGIFGGPGDTDANVSNAWNQYSGQGVVVTVVDDGLWNLHEDLRSRYRSQMSFDFKEPDFDPKPDGDDETHGTAVAGVIAASVNNSAGGSGAAPHAFLAGIKLDFENGWTALTEAQFLEYGGRDLEVQNNSWGATAAADAQDALSKAAFFRDITFGRGGLGTIITKSTGNSSLEGSEAFSDERTNNRYVIGVGAIDSTGKRSTYSQYGGSLDISAPSSGTTINTAGITTTTYVDDNSFSDYRNDFGGTSSASPLTAGVVALILEANPDLTWRDVRAVLELSAKRVDSSNAGWFRNAAGHWVNEEYGFGMVDATAAVNLARNWTNYSAERVYTSGSMTLNQAVTRNGTVRAVPVNTNLKVDQVEISFRVDHTSPEDLRFEVVSPSGTRVALIHEARFGVSGRPMLDTFSNGFSVSTDFFRDEVSLGNWQVIVSDKLGSASGVVRDLQFNVYGRDNGPAPPVGGTGPATINGFVWNDLDADGLDEAGEPRMQNVVVYVDVDNNGSISINEPSAVTNSQGIYSLRNVTPGPVVVRQAVPLGYRQNFPGGDGAYRQTPVPGEVRQNVKFGNTAGFDYGDARSTHGTKTAKHSIIPGISLGATVDAESNGIASTQALGDDVTGIDDEDGVTFPGFAGAAAGTGIQGTLVPGQSTVSRVTVSTGGKSSGLLHVWADFNQDGDFLDGGEKVVNNLRLGTGVFNVNIPTPSNAKTGTTYLRYRYSYDQNLSATGSALGGEVEDYRVQVLSNVPQPQPDNFSVRKFSLNNVLNVLTNDIPSTAGALSIIGVSSFSAGGSATITPDGKQLLYTPRANYLGQETFFYTVRDPSGKTAQAKVTMTVLPLSDLPLAVDDSFTVNMNASAQSLNVLANDTIGTGGPITVSNVTTPTGGGFVTIGSGATSVSYTPGNNFSGVDTFTYTVTNGLGASSTAEVSVTTNPKNITDLVEFTMETTNLNGDLISSINVGQEFLVKTYVKDLRPTAGPGSVAANLKGVYSAYSDVLYNSNVAYVKRDGGNPRGFDVVYGPTFIRGQDGNVAVDSIIDELGAFRDDNDPNTTVIPPAGDVLQLLSTVKMVASAGGTLVFTTNPHDGPFSDIVLQTETVPGSFDNQVAANRVKHATKSITINGSPEPASRGDGTASFAGVVSPLREALRQEASVRTTSAASPESTGGVDAALATWTPAPRLVDIPTYGGSSAKKSDAAVISLFSSGR